MTELEAIRARHSVRQYLNKPLRPDELAELRGAVSSQPGHAFYVKMDLGIAKYHFEIGAGKENFQWK